MGNLRLSNEGELHPIYRESLKPGGGGLYVFSRFRANLINFDVESFVFLEVNYKERGDYTPSAFRHYLDCQATSIVALFYWIM